jgi:hypothetical protein
MLNRTLQYHVAERNCRAEYPGPGYCMNKLLAFLLVSSWCILSGCQEQMPQTGAPGLCTDSWYQSVELAVSTGDGMGHGPDIGSAEWKSVVEFKLGIRENPDVPDRNSREWCRYIDALLEQKRP